MHGRRWGEAEAGMAGVWLVTGGAQRPGASRPAVCAHATAPQTGKRMFAAWVAAGYNYTRHGPGNGSW